MILDHTQARVPLCDTSAVATANQCETQEVASWSDTRVDLRINPGALPRNSTLYAFVVDRNGVFSPAFALNAAGCGPSTSRPRSRRRPADVCHSLPADDGAGYHSREHTVASDRPTLRVTYSL